MEVSFSKEVESLLLGTGATFHGEGILAITKALLQSGVAYVGGYQGAPVSHLLDVMVQAEPYMKELGVHVRDAGARRPAWLLRHHAALPLPRGAAKQRGDDCGRRRRSGTRPARLRGRHRCAAARSCAARRRAARVPVAGAAASGAAAKRP